MKVYINNILPRIRQFSESLDKKALLVDIPWVIIDENNNQQKYIFKKNGDLIMSLNGAVTMGRWEYLSSARSLLIDRIKDKILLNQDFVDNAVMLLRQDGIESDRFMLANEMLIPDLNIEKYLRNLYIDRNFIKLVETEDGQTVEIHRNDHYEHNYYRNLVTVEGVPIADGLVVAGQIRFVIQNGRIQKTLILKEFKTSKGVLYFEIEKDDKVCAGNRVFLNHKLAPDGVYKLSFFKSVEVKDGLVI